MKHEIKNYLYIYIYIYVCMYVCMYVYIIFGILNIQATNKITDTISKSKLFYDFTEQLYKYFSTNSSNMIIVLGIASIWPKGTNILI